MNVLLRACGFMFMVFTSLSAFTLAWVSGIVFGYSILGWVFGLIGSLLTIEVWKLIEDKTRIVTWFMFGDFGETE